MEKLWKTTKNPSQYNRFYGRDLNPAPPEHEAGCLLQLFLKVSLLFVCLFVSNHSSFASSTLTTNVLFFNVLADQDRWSRIHSEPANSSESRFLVNRLCPPAHIIHLEASLFACRNGKTNPIWLWHLPRFFLATSRGKSRQCCKPFKSHCL